jgi:hypothetical protein
MPTIHLYDQLRQDVDAVAETLNRSNYLGKGQIHNLNSKLDKLFNRVDSLQKSQNIFNIDLLNEQRVRLITLWGRFHTLEIDSKVVDLAEKAQDLYRATAHQIENEVVLIKRALDEIKHSYALSIENKKIVHFTEIIMQRLQGQKPLEGSLSELNLQNPDADEVIQILEIAKALYDSRYTEAKTLFFVLSRASQQAINSALNEHEIDLNTLFDISLKNFKRPSLAVKVLVGYCYLITLENYRFELPSDCEVEDLFSESTESSF